VLGGGQTLPLRLAQEAGPTVLEFAGGPAPSPRRPKDKSTLQLLGNGSSLSPLGYPNGFYNNPGHWSFMLTNRRRQWTCNAQTVEVPDKQH